jgi:uncharacterized membrane protein
MWAIIRAVAVISSGLYSGIIFGDRIGASYSRAALSPGAFIQFQQVQHLHFKPILMPLTIIAVLASVIWALQLWRGPKRAEFWLASAAAAAMLLAFIVTRVVNFPINDALMTWSAAMPPTDVRELWSPWERAHSVRAAASVAAFALQVIALVIRRSS